MEAAEVVGIIPDIDGQIYARDFKLIDQSDQSDSIGLFNKQTRTWTGTP